jgi:hypothetical protein
MAAQRRSGRFVSVAAIVGPLVAAGVVWAGPAQADPISYINDLPPGSWTSTAVMRRCW